jgi:RNA polymerase sigma factor (sigma-70 family)
VNLSDLQIQAKSGNKEAEKLLFSHLSERFRAFAYHRVWNRDDAEELVQDALVVIAREYRQLEVQASFQAWAYKVLDNRILAYVKRRKTERSSLEDVADLKSGPPNYELQRQLEVCLRKLLKTNRRYGRMLSLCHQGFAIGEICERLRITRNNAYVILSRARSLLESCLQTGRIET